MGEPLGPVDSDPAVPPVAGSGRRFQLNAVHTSKACNIISKYTAFVPVDLSTSSYLPTLVQYTHTGNVGLAQGWNLVLAGKAVLINVSQGNEATMCYEATAQFGTRPVPKAVAKLLVAQTSSHGQGKGLL